MAYQIPDVEPSSVIAGETAEWSRSFPDYPANVWALTYTLLNSSGKITIDATANGTDFLVHVLPAATGQWAAGIYKWQAQVTDGTDVYNVGYGTIEIVQGFAAAAAAGAETRSQAKQTLDAIEAYLADTNNLQAANYTIAGRTLSRHNIPDLLKLRDRYRIDVKNEESADRIARGMPSKNKIRVRF